MRSRRDLVTALAALEQFSSESKGICAAAGTGAVVKRVEDEFQARLVGRKVCMQFSNAVFG